MHSGGKTVVVVVGALLAGSACVLANDFDAYDRGGSDAGPDGTPPPDVVGDAGADAGPVCAADASFVSDNLNCGSCGHDCLGGTCIDSACTPVQLATGVAYLVDIHLDGDYVYFGASNRGLSRVPRIGGTIEDLASATTVYDFSFDTTAIFYAGDQHLRRLGRSGGDTLIEGSQADLSVLATDDWVYWCNYGNAQQGNGVLYRQHDNDAGTRQTVAASLMNCETIAVSGSDVVFGANGNSGSPTGVFRVPGSGGNPTRLSTHGARRLVVRDGFVYFVTTDSIDVRRVPVDGSAPDVLLGQSPGAAIGTGTVAADDAYVYWTVAQSDDQGGGVYRAPKDGSGPTTAIAPKRNKPWGIAVDDRAVYWSDQGTGKIFKIAK